MAFSKTAQLTLGVGMRILVFLIPTCLFAQFGAPAPQGQPARASQLPLSGKGAQNGGAVTTTESPVAGTTNSVNTINPTIQIQGPFAGSATGNAPFPTELSFREAINRGLQYNLGAVGLTNAVRQAQGQTKVARSALLPNINGNLTDTVEQLDLAASGIRFHIPIPGASVPTVVGPFNYFNLQATLSQSVVDMTARNNYRASKQSLIANQMSAKDARDLVVLAVGGAYLQVVVAAARLQSVQAQLDTANALFEQTSQQKNVGLVAQIDVNRSHIGVLTQKQRLATLQNDLAKQKINLARLVGLPPNDHFNVSDSVPFAAAPDIALEDALKQAFGQRWDLKAAEAQVQAALRTKAAARAERLPAVSLNANYGVIGEYPSSSHGVFNVTGSLTFPIWQSGRIEGDVEQADAAVAQRQAELEDLRGHVESEVRSAYLDLEAAKTQRDVAQENLQVNQDNLKLSRQRFDAGVTDNVEVVQSQEAVASAELDYINSVFAHNIAKLTLARATGQAAEKLAQFLQINSH
jgi:outer membrane protein TolC